MDFTPPPVEEHQWASYVPTRKTKFRVHGSFGAAKSALTVTTYESIGPQPIGGIVYTIENGRWTEKYRWEPDTHCMDCGRRYLHRHGILLLEEEERRLGTPVLRHHRQLNDRTPALEREYICGQCKDRQQANCAHPWTGLERRSRKCRNCDLYEFQDAVDPTIWGPMFQVRRRNPRTGEVLNQGTYYEPATGRVERSAG